MTFYNFYNPSIHSGAVRGTLTSTLDLFSFHEHESKLHNCSTEPGSLLMLAHKNKNFGLNDFKINQNLFCKDDIIVISARVLADSTIFQGIKIECDKLIILDSADIYRGHLGIGPDVERTLKFNKNIKFKEVIWLCNPANKITEYPSIEHYHKFNVKRIRTLYDDKMYSYKRTDKEYLNVFGNYFENIGKNILERIILGIPVEYKGSDIKDGLYYYLKYIGIDSTKDQVIENIIDANKLY